MLLTDEQRRAMEYLARKGTQAPVATLRAQLRQAFEGVERAFDEVPAEVRDRSPAAGKWSPREILDHLVLSHDPAIAQLASLLSGVTPEPVAVPAGRRTSGTLPEWAALRTRLGGIHEELLRLVESASDDSPLEPKVVVEMVVKVDSEPRHWFERLDWKAFVQAIRMHTLEHRDQLQRALLVPHGGES